mmetsp:Transcript_19786/g.54499  ORF Transcript_19786/g.54499 Transcript_19786/m.54499 type:complete len:124 (+) Transcript_19786:623-994(+)
MMMMTVMKTWLRKKGYLWLSGGSDQMAKCSLFFSDAAAAASAHHQTATNKQYPTGAKSPKSFPILCGTRRDTQTVIRHRHTTRHNNNNNNDTTPQVAKICRQTHSLLHSSLLPLHVYIFFFSI